MERRTFVNYPKPPTVPQLVWPTVAAFPLWVKSGSSGRLRCVRFLPDSKHHAATEGTAPTHQPLESVRRLRKVEQIENRMAKLIAGASIVSTAGDAPIRELVFPRGSRNRVQGRPSDRSKPDKCTCSALGKPHALIACVEVLLDRSRRRISRREAAERLRQILAQ